MASAIRLALTAAVLTMVATMLPVALSARYHVIVGVDGLGGEFYLPYASSTPVMDGLMANGSFTLEMQDVITTSSSQNWMSMIAGSAPDQHGVYDNGWEVGDSEPTPTIFATLKEQKADSNVTIGIFVQWCGFTRLVEPDVPDVMECPGDEDETMSAAIDFLLGNTGYPIPDLLFVHLDHVDHAGHSRGWGSSAYYRAIEKADRLIGNLVDALEKRGIIHETALFISADHGGKYLGHDPDTELHRYIPFIAWGQGIARGRLLTGRELRIYDMAATVAEAMGLARPDSWTARPIHEVFESYVPSPAPTQMLLVRMVTEYQWIYDSTGSGSRDPVSIWRPVAPSGYVIVGDVAVPGLDKPTFATPVLKYDASILVNPTALEEMWNDKGSGGDFDVAVWNPTPPFGYTCLGNIAIGAYTEEPERNQVFCLNSRYLIQDQTPQYIWDDTRSGADWDGSFWGTTGPSSPPASAGIDLKTFFTRRNHAGPGYNKQFWLNKNQVVIDE